MKIINFDCKRSIRELFSAFCDDSFALLLDSAGAHPASQFSFFSSQPSQVISLEKSEELDKSALHNCKLQLIQALENQAADAKENNEKKVSSLPFTGGWIGFAEYELGRLIQGLAPKKPIDRKKRSINKQTPLLWAGFYEWVVIYNHQTKSFQLIHSDKVSNKERDALLQRIKQAQNTEAAIEPLKAFSASSFKQNTSKEKYAEDFKQIQNYLLAGDCYQINYAQQYQTQYQGHPYQAFQQLAETVPSPFMAYINLEQHCLLSISPERFISAKQGQLLSSPIKGTEKRSQTPKEDLQLAQDLQNSIKNRAENLMIVDLIRNDLGKFCQTGSVKAERLFEIESFSNVHHLVSHVEGKLKDNKHFFDLFFDAFPGGSITGAPKQRAMQIIDELEDFERGIYCGSIFSASTHDVFDTNIAIRTLLCNKQDNTVSAWAGGGIVKDSELESEYQECANKIQKLLQAITQ